MTSNYKLLILIVFLLGCKGKEKDKVELRSEGIFMDDTVRPIHDTVYICLRKQFTEKAYDQARWNDVANFKKIITPKK